MRDEALGRAIRIIRRRAGMRQADLALAAMVSRAMLGEIEHGRLDNVTIGAMRRASDALDARLQLTVHWQGAELDRLIDREHAALSEVVARLLKSLGWLVTPEVSFSVYGERGAIDLLGFHAATGMALVVEVKTELGDLQATLATLDRKLRLAHGIARERGHHARAVSAWLVLIDTRTNRRHLAQHAIVLRAALPVDGRALRPWLSDPRSSVRALSFMPVAAVDDTGKRVVTRRDEPARRARSGGGGVP